MDRQRAVRSLFVFMTAFMLAMCGAAAAQGGGTAQSSSAAAAMPAMFAPYVDMAEPNSNLPQIMAASGTRHFTLAFVQSVNGCEPGWGGSVPVARDTTYGAYIDKLRAAGGDVIIAFGGYGGTDLAQACTDPASLQRAYQRVIDQYKVKILDFDVEHFAIENQVSIDRRSQALKALAAANPGIQFHYTLPASPAGLTAQAVNVIKSAAANGTPVAVVNVMAMDYGAPVPDGAMGPNAVAAAAGALCQIKAMGMNARVGITPMIGANDTPGETFSLTDAQVVIAYANANRDSVALLSFWSVGRDNGGCSQTVSPTCSGIAQKPWEFSKVFQAFEAPGKPAAKVRRRLVR